jgi:hypothetical protein
MFKFATALKIFKILVRNPQQLARIIDSEAEFRDYVIRTYGFQFGLPKIDLLDLLPGLHETVEPYSFLEGGSLPTDLALLKGLVRKYKLSHYFEIGTWRGESVANVASVATKCISLRLSDEEMKQKGYSDDVIAVHEFFSKGLSNVTHIYHNSASFDFSSLGENFDLIYIDGDHDYDPIKSDTRNAFTLLRNQRSVIVWHGYGNGTEKGRWSSLAGILDGCPPDKRNSLYHVSNTKCTIYIRGTFEAKFKPYPEMPDKNFPIELSAKRIGPSLRLSSTA